SGPRRRVAATPALAPRRRPRNPIAPARCPRSCAARLWRLHRVARLGGHHRPQAVTVVTVGWVERSEANHGVLPPVGLAALDPPYLSTHFSTTTHGSRSSRFELSPGVGNSFLVWRS